jgi:hypothetical protein
MDCEILVAGDGVGKYGRTKKDRRGPLKDFLVDNQVLYSAVTKHLQKCQVCSIEEVLKVYLSRRAQEKKFRGQTSTTLVKRALILERLAQKQNRPVPRGLVNEFLWRYGTLGVIEHSDRLSLREKVEAFRVDPNNTFLLPKLGPVDRYLHGLVHQGLNGDVTEEDLEELIKVAEVMLS